MGWMGNGFVDELYDHDDTMRRLALECTNNKNIQRTATV
jgi:hypothetical protein